MKEKNCIITGGTSGLGLSLVKKFIQNGFFVHIIARDNKKIKKLLNYFNEKKLNLFKFYQADLSEKTEIERVLFEIKKLNNIDIIINNAGAIFLSKELNSKGLEKTLAVNYLSHFFLTTSLIDLIKRNKKSRIINIFRTRSNKITMCYNIYIRIHMFYSDRCSYRFLLPDIC